MSYPDFLKTVPQRPDLSPLLKSVESMGSSCDVGLVQKHCKADPLSLLRSAYTPLNGLIEALHNQFDGIGNPAEYDYVVSQQNEWKAHHKRYLFEFHTLQSATAVPESRARETGTERLKFLADVFMETLRDGEKLFVYRPRSPGPSTVLRQELLQAMRRYGNAQLMWLDIPQDESKVGTAEWTEPGSLITGYIDRFPSPSTTANFDVYIQVIQSADRLRRGQAGMMAPMRRRG